MDKINSHNIIFWHPRNNNTTAALNRLPTVGNTCTHIAPYYVRYIETETNIIDFFHMNLAISKQM